MGINYVPCTICNEVVNQDMAYYGCLIDYMYEKVYHMNICQECIDEYDIDYIDEDTEKELKEVEEQALGEYSYIFKINNIHKMIENIRTHHLFKIFELIQVQFKNNCKEEKENDKKRD